MSFFSSKSKYVLGVDFGTQSIKAVVLKAGNNGKPELVNYGWVNVTNVKEVPDAYDSDYAKRLSDALDELFVQMKPRTKKAMVAIPSFNGLVMVVDFPRMSEKEIANAIKFESRKYIPASLDEVNVSWEILDEDVSDEKNNKAEEGVEVEKKEPETMQVLLVAAPKSEVQYYDGLFKGVDVSIETLELESFSIARSVIGETKGRFIVVDIGAKTTNVILVRDGVVFVNRSVDIGGADITNVIMESMNISRKKALSIKESDDNFFTGAAKIGFPSLNFIANEVKRVLSTQKNDKIESLILCGGGSNLTGLPEYFNQLTGLNVVIGNPLSHIVYNKKNSGNIEEISNSMAVAIGLAMRGMEKK
ncbi:MAG: type IV pilus assembly protein PilM [Patescibacteria group bacterium]